MREDKYYKMLKISLIAIAAINLLLIAAFAVVYRCVEIGKIISSVKIILMPIFAVFTNLVGMLLVWIFLKNRKDK